MKTFLRIKKIYESHAWKREKSAAPMPGDLGALVRVLAAVPDGAVSTNERSRMNFLFGPTALPLYMRYTVCTEDGRLMEVFSDEVNPVSNEWLATQHEQRERVAA